MQGRWFFLLYSDFFNIEGNLIGGKHSSTGVISLTCLNLPLHIRNDPAYTYVAGIIQGPHEPSAENAQHRQYARPLVDDLLAGYTRGITCATTHRVGTGTEGAGYKRVEKVVIAGQVMDLKCARPTVGLMDVNSHTPCFTCKLWHRSNLLNIHFKWGNADDGFLRRGAEAWLKARTYSERSSIEKRYGTRYSEFWRLPY